MKWKAEGISHDLLASSVPAHPSKSLRPEPQPTSALQGVTEATGPWVLSPEDSVPQEAQDKRSVGPHTRPMATRRQRHCNVP